MSSASPEQLTLLGEQPSADDVATLGSEVADPFVDTHWGTKVMVIQDPDGHRFCIQAPVGE